MPSLFLDRDGVINTRIPGDYVTRVAQFIFKSGAVEAISTLSRYFSPIIVVTNQAGIGKGLMTEYDLMDIHGMMVRTVEAAGGRIDAVYYCPHRSDAGCSCRKPSTGMGELARLNFPQFDWADAWMVGDSYSDILFGQALDIKTALISGKSEERDQLAATVVDWRGESLTAFADFVSEKHIHTTISV